jgi:hypothetical protein
MTGILVHAGCHDALKNESLAVRKDFFFLYVPTNSDKKAVVLLESD